MFIRALILASAIAVLAPAGAWPQSAPTYCDTLASFPYDPERTAPGIAYERIKPSAVNACADAVAEFPKSGRLWFQYGRALERTGMVRQAVEAYRTARRLGHPGGANNLGELHRQGKGGSRDAAQAETYFREAAAAGYPEGAYNLATLLIKSGAFDRDEVGRLVGIATQAGYPGSSSLLLGSNANDAFVSYSRSEASVSTPQQGSPLRRALLDALRPHVEEKLDAPIEFLVKEIKVSGDWAFAQIVPQRPGGAPIRVLETPMARFHELMGDDVHTEAVLHREGGAWRVEAFEIGSTDVWYTDWCDRLPKAMFRIGNEPGICD